MRRGPGHSRFKLSAFIASRVLHGRPRGGGRIDNACGASPATLCFHPSKLKTLSLSLLEVVLAVLGTKDKNEKIKVAPERLAGSLLEVILALLGTIFCIF